MKTIFSRLNLILATVLMILCQAKAMANSSSGGNRTLIVYYSYTNNTEEIVADLKTLISADVIEIEPAEKGLDYAANGYRLGTEQLNKIKANPNSESSYPAIDPVEVDMSNYSTVIIATPLWWSQMASNMQTFLFKYGKEMEGKNIGLIVSSHSSGISGVEADAKRLVPKGNFFSKSLWINASNHSRRKSLLEQWLKDVDYANKTTSAIMNIEVNNHILTVDLANNSSAEALVALLEEAPITYEAHDYGNFEKVGEIGHTLPQNNEQITTEPGDIILYQGNSICIYYDTNTWSFTRLGKIQNITKEELKNILGNGSVMVTLSLDDPTGVDAMQTNMPKATPIYDINGKQINEAPSKGIYIENGIKKAKL